MARNLGNDITKQCQKPAGGRHGGHPRGSCKYEPFELQTCPESEQKLVVMFRQGRSVRVLIISDSVGEVLVVKGIDTDDR